MAKVLGDLEWMATLEILKVFPSIPGEGDLPTEVPIEQHVEAIQEEVEPAEENPTEVREFVEATSPLRDQTINPPSESSFQTPSMT